MIKKESAAYRWAAFLAVAVFLLRVHPSLPTLAARFSIPAYFIWGLLALPLLGAIALKQKWCRRDGIVAWPFLALIIWLLVRAVTSPAFGLLNNLSSIRSIAVLMPIALLCAALAAKSPKIVLVTIFLLSSIAVGQYLQAILIGHIDAFGEAKRFHALFSDLGKSSYQSTSLYFGLLATIAGAIFVAKRGLGLFVGAFMFLGIIALMGTVGARACMVAVVAALVAMAVIHGAGGMARLTMVGLLTVAIVAVASAIGRLDMAALLDRFVITYRFAVLGANHDSSHRIWLFSSAIHMWVSSPANFIIGGGIGTFPAFIGEWEQGWYPHNFILESLAEGGIIAGMLLLIIAVKFIRALNLFAARPNSFEHVCLSGLAVYAMTAYQFMGGLESLWFSTFFLALFMFYRSDVLAADARGIEKENKTGNQARWGGSA